MEDDDIAMCGEGTGSINAKEKDGYVKEYIETEGLAMILSKVNFVTFLWIRCDFCLVSVWGKENLNIADVPFAQIVVLLCLNFRL